MSGWFWKIYCLIFNMAAKRKIISIHEKKKKGLTLGRFFYWIAFLAFLGGIAYSLFFAGFLSVSKIEISGLRELDEKNVREAAESEIAGKYLKFIEKNNLLLIRGKSIEGGLKGRFAKIESADVRKKFPDTLIISIKERESAIILCTGAECFMVDEGGTAYSRTDYSLPEISENRLVILKDLSSKNIDAGSIVFSADYLGYIRKIEEKIGANFDFRTEKEYETPSRISADIRAKTKEGWMIFFNENIDLEKEIDMLKVVLDEKIGDKRKDLEYVDLRSDNKVYYKFRQGSQEEVNKEENNKSQPVPAEEKKESEKKKK
jgi:cell division septal protein FtsQ